MEKSTKTPSAEELLRKIQELEKHQSHLKQDISKLQLSGNQKKSTNSTYPHRAIDGPGGAPEPGLMEPLSMKLTEAQYLKILQSTSQAVHVYCRKGRIIFWNRAAEKLFGFSPAEAYGKLATELLAEPKDYSLADQIIQRTVNGETWYEEFPIKNKRGEKFVIIATITPIRDETRGLVGAMCVSIDHGTYHVRKAAQFGFDSHQPLQIPIATKISNLVSKVKLKMRTGDNYMDDEAGSDVANDHSQASTQRIHILSPFGDFFSTITDEYFTKKITIDFGDENRNKTGIRKFLSSKADAWVDTKRSVWPWKGNGREVESLDPIFGRFGWQRAVDIQELKLDPQKSSCASTKVDYQVWENTNSSYNKMEASGFWPSLLHAGSTNSTSSSSSGTRNKSNAIIKVEWETDNLDYEIFWEDLITREQIGKGSCGTVYQALWHGSDVAVKLFVNQEYPNDMIVSFKQEVSLMKKLQHPNILLFMGAVTSPPHLCIVTELLPRGSLFRILQRNTSRLDWKRRLHMAMDIAQGMNYLHHCNPPIIHRDLKSSNLLVDKNWSVKVGDFGLSSIKHHTYLKTKSWRGTPQWMAPEILRNEQADEKCDVYSYGVVLWEITTEKIPWDDLHPMQFALVGYRSRRVHESTTRDSKRCGSLWASLIESCWCSEPHTRPTFQEILYKLEDLQKKFVVGRRRRE